MLLRRWRYWSDIKKFRIEEVLRILSEEEFFISEKTILTILKNYVADDRHASARQNKLARKIEDSLFPES
ncbi:MAG: transposase [Bacteroidales bacterium]